MVRSGQRTWCLPAGAVILGRVVEKSAQLARKIVEVTTPCGSHYYVTRSVAIQLAERKEAQFIDKFAMVVCERPSERYIDLSKRCQWRPWDSGGATVMQLR